MKFDIKTIVAMIQRKGVTLLAGVAIGSVFCAESAEFFALVKQAIVLFGGGGSILTAVSIYMSIKNEQNRVVDTKPVA